MARKDRSGTGKLRFFIICVGDTTDCWPCFAHKTQGELTLTSLFLTAYPLAGRGFLKKNLTVGDGIITQ
ncbi:hypothetical protein AA18895_1957 [Acetobacter ghanensis DSM 18895]|nr:hypothetical protein AA18895_1957 [Acetobacter ghanensis DSM 18895]